MKTKKIVVVGSTNMDMVVNTSHIPTPGETVLAESFFMNPGGKGANQAVAVARLGGEISFISKVGDDIYGKKFARLFNEEGINTDYILCDQVLPSGVALITVDQFGENTIVVAAGANGNLLPSDLTEALTIIESADIVLMQLEIPMETINFVAEYAASKNVMVILDPAPACELPSGLLSHIDIITPNQSEAEIVTGINVFNIETAKEAARAIHERGVKTVIITMGNSGAVVFDQGQFHLVPAQKVETLDSTAAGDVFNGALAVALSEGNELVVSAQFASLAAAISVTRMGAQASIPYRKEVIMPDL